MSNEEFNEVLWQFYDQRGRHDLPWRQPAVNGRFNPYKIVVSELMLQQTQVSRVIPKFHEFLIKFPTVQALAVVDLVEVIKTWSGLGYNRRAKFLWQTAQAVAVQGGTFPDTLEGLVTLPGIGKNTAGAVLAYAFNKPLVFIETNIRTVYIHHFFNDQADIPDNIILKKLQQTLDREHPREFYWALMDYGSYLKQTVGNLNRLSKSYTKQSTFQGSKRQIRGQVLRLLSAGPLNQVKLKGQITDQRLSEVLDDLTVEELIVFDLGSGEYRL